MGSRADDTQRVAGAGAALALAGGVYAQASFEELTDRKAYDATDDAQMLVGTSGEGFCSFAEGNASRWTRPEGWRWIDGICAPFWGQAMATSRTGDVIGGIAYDAGFQVEFIFRWSSADEVQLIGDPLTGAIPWTNWAEFREMSRGGGTIVATLYPAGSGGTSRPVRWTGSEGWRQFTWNGEVLLGRAADAADDGTVVGSGWDAAAEAGHAFRWTPGAETVLLPIPAGFDSSSGEAVTPDGRQVFGVSGLAGGPGHLTRWDAAGREEDLGAMPFGGEVRGVSPTGVDAEGWVVVGVWNATGEPGNEPAFIWNARDGIRDLRDVLVDQHGLDVGAFRVRSPVAISDDGRRVVGNEYFDRRGYVAWRATLPAYCRPDCTGDGLLNINDFICFQARWRARDIYGDFNNDAAFNVNDFIAFQAGWRTGCE